MNDSVSSGFDIVIEEVDNFYTTLANEIKKLVEKRELEKADRILELAKKIEAFKEKVTSLKKEWQASFKNINNELLTIENEGKRTNNQDQSGKLRRGLKTPQKEYYLPILESLIELGGRAQINDVLSKVREKMSSVLNRYDFDRLKNGEERWKNTAQWARFEMVKEGLLSDSSPNGIWEITEKGRKYYEEHKKKP